MGVLCENASERQESLERQIAKKQIAKVVFQAPGYPKINLGQLQKVFDCIVETEKMHEGNPVYKLEVYQTWQNNGYGPNDTTSDAMTYFHHLITNLFKQDRILGDFEFGMVSTNPKFQMNYGSG